jgi:hypothetical protein
MEDKTLSKAAVSVIIYPAGQGKDRGGWPPVVFCGPDEEDDQGQETEGRQILELIYDSVRVVGILVEQADRKIIRVEVHQRGQIAHPCADTNGEPTLK